MNPQVGMREESRDMANQTQFAPASSPLAPSHSAPCREQEQSLLTSAATVQRFKDQTMRTGSPVADPTGTARVRIGKAVAVDSAGRRSEAAIVANEGRICVRLSREILAHATVERSDAAVRPQYFLGWRLVNPEHDAESRRRSFCSAWLCNHLHIHWRGTSRDAGKSVSVRRFDTHSMVPQTDPIDTFLGLPLINGDTVYRYNNVAGGYDGYLYHSDGQSH